MLPTRWLTVVCAVLLGGAPAANGQIEPSRHFSRDFQYRALQAVVRITLHLDGRHSQGSGVCIEFRDGYSYILTAAHVVKGIEKSRGLTVETFTKQSYPNPADVFSRGQVTYALNEGYDLALLKVPVRVPVSIKLCPPSAQLPLRTPVLMVGCGIGAPPTCAVAELIGQDGRKDLVMNRGAIGGRSGGLACTRFGLTGILARAGDDQTHAVNPWKIHAFLRDCRPLTELIRHER